MSLRKPALNALLILLAGCASAPAPAPVAPQAIVLGEAEIGALADILRREDMRSYDAAAFRAHLESRNPTVRMFAVRALGRIADRSAIAPLQSALSDSVLRVRAEAAFALGEIGDTTASVINALGELTRGSDEAAAEALAALGKLRTDAAWTFIERVLTTTAPPLLLREALLSSWRYPRRSERTQLIARYTRHADEEVRWRATYAMTRGPADPAYVPWLIDLLKTAGSTYTASFAARGLRAAAADSAIKRIDAIAALLTRSNDANQAVRINSITALTGYRDSTVAAQLVPVLAHADLNTRIAAAQALGAGGGSIGLSALEQAVRDAAQRPVVRGAALAALAANAPDRAGRLIEELERSPEWLLRLYAARAAAALRSDAALPVLRRLATDRDARVAVAAVEGAAGARDTLPAARALFIERLGTTDPFLRAAALSGLERYADPADQILLFDAYARAQRDTVPEAAVAALDAIAKLMPKNAAVERAFRVRFPASSDCVHADVRRALNRHFQYPEQCTFQPALRVYEQIVREYLLPGLNGRNPRARLTTGGTVIEVELLAAAAPLTVRNLVTLAGRRYFDGARWHRVVPNFVIQDGDPYGNGSGGPGYAIRDEMNRERYLEGTLGMALSGPDTGGSQFFITHSPQPHLDGGYTVFGRVVNGMSGVFAVVQDDVIERIEIVR
jgi:cyclophilin family peptidyl-prolyl cis-trans isomerase/HEAT repeat protein